jgi:hypothetical protein
VKQTGPGHDTNLPTSRRERVCVKVKLQPEMGVTENRKWRKTHMVVCGGNRQQLS